MDEPTREHEPVGGRAQSAHGTLPSDQPAPRHGQPPPRRLQPHGRRRVESSQHNPQARLVQDVSRLDQDQHSAPDTAYVQARLAAYESTAVAASTGRRYQQAWQDWITWASACGIDIYLPTGRDAQHKSLSSYVIYLRDRGNKASTIRSKLCGISWHHLLYTGYPDSISARLHVALDGMQREDPATRRALPVCTTMLWHVQRSIDQQVPHQQSLWGATLLGYFFVLRRSEYLARGRVPPQHGIKLSDVYFSTKNGTMATKIEDAVNVHVTVCSSKTDQRSQGTTLQLSKTGCNWLCPVLSIWWLRHNALMAGAGPSDPLCTTKDQLGRRRAINEADVCKLLRTAAVAMGKDSKRFTCHSLRRGVTTALFRSSTSTLEIQKFGRWSSDAYKVYAAIDDIQLGQLSKNMTIGAPPHHTLW